MTEPTERQDDIDTTAAHWVARLGDTPLDAADAETLDRWLAEDPRHAAAFAEARTAWRAMDEVALSPGELRRDLPQAAITRLPTRPPIRWRQLAAMAASVLFLTAGAALWFGDPRIMLVADHQTAPGERRTLTLADGSVVELGPASAIALRYSDTERRVELLSGIACFTAAPRQGNERRPFIVEAASGTARALGTQFMVDRISDSVEVVVIEHEVAVATESADGNTTQVVLSPGQSVRYGSGELAALRSVNLEQMQAWRQGRLVFDRVPLGDVVADINRYRRGRIVIGNSRLAARQVSGVFDTADPDAVLATIARELGVRMTSAPLVTVLY